MRALLTHPAVQRALPYIGIFVVAYTTHFFSGVIASGDSRWSIPMAYSLVYEGDLNLDEFPELLDEHEYYWVEEIDGHWVNRFPIGIAVLSAPFVLVLDQAAQFMFWIAPGIEERIIASSVKPLTEVNVITMYWRIELVIACFFMSTATLFMFGTAHEFLSIKKALIITFWFLFCTSVWSVGSRALGQHCGSILMLSITLYLIVIARKHPRWIQFAALPLAMAFVIRPTNALPIIAISVYVLIQHRDYFPKYVGWACMIAIPFFIYNFSIYDAPFSPYYMPQDQLGSEAVYEVHYFTALAGLLISPARGLLVYCPLFIFSLYGLWLARKQAHKDWLYPLLGGCILVHWLLIASFGDWWGGHSYGPRYFSDLTPFFVFLLIP
ncbi:MAG: hypothetical protein VCD00_14725, partial [Candidatus Hydrogenedentota bacterium]